MKLGWCRSLALPFFLAIGLSSANSPVSAQYTIKFGTGTADPPTLESYLANL